MNVLKMGLINKKSLKKKFKDKNAKINNEIARKFINKLEKDVDKNIEMIVRNMKISGRKVVREEDIEEH